MKQKFSERRIVLALLVAMTIEILLLLLHLGVISFAKPSARSTASVAGQIARTQNELRRRGADSLVWEKSADDDAVYFHDSVLTLSQSTATLHLFQQTEVNLSENTLVTIEPPDEREHGEIRLRFVKGNLKARNPFHNAKIDGAEWTVDLHQGSEVEFRQIDGENFELQVTKGEALFKSKSGERSTVKTNELLRVDKDQTSRLEIDSRLEWSQTPAERIYTHGENLRLPLRWKGAAAQLVVQSLGQKESVQTLGSGTESASLDLPLGQHRVFLRDGSKTSPPLNVQVWRAPVVHLLQPLPRDREATDSNVQFVWTQIPGVESFQLVQEGARGRREMPVKENSSTARFSKPENLQWSVFAKDADGFLIPPLYSYPLFIRENPLAPPKLKLPQMRQPAAEKGAGLWRRLWNEMWPEAYAEDLAPMEALFEWESVEGADQYVLEISNTADFRTPVVMKTLIRPQFAWRGFKLQAYYWRVAAGTKRGRMGLFSEPAQVNFQDLGGGGSVDGVKVRRLVEPVKAKLAEPVAAATPPAPAPAPARLEPMMVTAPPVAIKAPPFRRLVGWRPVLTHAHLEAKDQVRAKLSGSTAAGGIIEWPVHLAAERVLQITLSYSQTTFRPEPQASYPLQKNLSWQDAGLTAIYYKTWWGYGMEAKNEFSVRRASYETLSASSQVAVGPTMGAFFESGNLQFRARLSGLIHGDGGGAVGAQLETRARFWNRWILGAGIEGQAGFQPGGTSTLGQGFFLTGFDF